MVKYLRKDALSFQDFSQERGLKRVANRIRSPVAIASIKVKPPGVPHNEKILLHQGYFDVWLEAE